MGFWDRIRIWDAYQFRDDSYFLNSYFLSAGPSHYYLVAWHQSRRRRQSILLSAKHSNEKNSFAYLWITFIVLQNINILYVRIYFFFNGVNVGSKLQKGQETCRWYFTSSFCALSFSALCCHYALPLVVFFRCYFVYKPVFSPQARRWFPKRSLVEMSSSLGEPVAGLAHFLALGCLQLPWHVPTLQMK